MVGLRAAADPPVAATAAAARLALRVPRLAVAAAAAAVEQRRRALGVGGREVECGLRPPHHRAFVRLLVALALRARGLHLPHDLGDDVEVEHVRTEDARLHVGREGGRREGLGGGDGEVEAEAVGRSAASRTCTWTTFR